MSGTECTAARVVVKSHTSSYHPVPHPVPLRSLAHSTFGAFAIPSNEEISVVVYHVVFVPM